MNKQSEAFPFTLKKQEILHENRDMISVNGSEGIEFKSVKYGEQLTMSQTKLVLWPRVF